jgi:hypothetical protein
VAGAATKRLQATSSAAAHSASLTRSTFASLLGSTFHMSGGGSGYDVVLTEIDDLDSSSTGPSEDQFSLVFSGSTSRPRTSGIRTFRHAKIGAVDMFVSPVDRGARALRLQSVINRN